MMHDDCFKNNGLGDLLDVLTLTTGTIQLHAQNIQPGDLFIALQGNTTHGKIYLPEAFKNGAHAALVENNTLLELKIISNEPLIIEVPNLRQQLGYIANYFFDQPSKDLVVIGITGTNGKTSSAFYIAQLLEVLNCRTGYLGTLGRGFPEALSPSSLTTADAISVHQDMINLKTKGAKAIAMEVSSHALDQYRVNGVQFNTAIFTNLTHDHLDYHKTMEAYAACKARLFHVPGLKHAIVNIDDPYANELIKNIPYEVEIIGITVGAASGDRSFPLRQEVFAHSQKGERRSPLRGILKADNIQYRFNGLAFTLKSPWGNASINTALLGHFNIYNLLTTLAAVLTRGYAFSDVISQLPNIKPTPGRMETHQRGQSPTLIIDYAHTPDALDKLIHAAKQHFNGKIFCIFGCGGERDKAKRPVMGRVAEQHGVELIITNDNPRTESPEHIMADILSGLAEPARAKVEPDRAQAIQWALSQANAQDVILIAGKGHEDYQIIGNQKRDLSDKRIVTRMLEDY